MFLDVLQGEFMTHQQGGRIAVLKRILGWVIFIAALLSTLTSVLNFVYENSKSTTGINAVILDFVHVMVDMVRFNTPFLNVFWYNAPLPALSAGITLANIMFVIIYWLVFLGIALQASGVKMSLQVKRIRENVQDQLIMEQTKDGEKRTREAIESRIDVPNSPIYKQYFPLFILPIIIAVVAYFVLKLTGLIA